MVKRKGKRQCSLSVRLCVCLSGSIPISMFSPSRSSPSPSHSISLCYFVTQSATILSLSLWLRACPFPHIVRWTGPGLYFTDSEEGADAADRWSNAQCRTPRTPPFTTWTVTGKRLQTHYIVLAILPGELKHSYKQYKHMCVLNI